MTDVDVGRREKAQNSRKGQGAVGKGGEVERLLQEDAEDRKRQKNWRGNKFVDKGVNRPNQNFHVVKTTFDGEGLNQTEKLVRAALRCFCNAKITYFQASSVSVSC